MISVSDIVKLLEQVPLWKSMAALPRRLNELEARVKALEGGQAQRAAPGPTDCPNCRIPFRFVSETDHPVFGDIGGLKIHALHCDGCGMDVTREYTSAKGYK